MIDILYTSMRSSNTHDFIQKLVASGIPPERVSRLETPEQTVSRPFVLFTASYCGRDDEGMFHPVLSKWFKAMPEWHRLCRGTVVSGNMQFGKRFGIAGRTLQQQHNIPRLHSFELKGQPKDVRLVMSGMTQMFGAYV